MGFHVELELELELCFKFSPSQADWAGKEFMFDIVANKRNGLDVDKLDYLKRDNMACGEITVSDFGSLLESMRVSHAYAIHDMPV